MQNNIENYYTEEKIKQLLVEYKYSEVITKLESTNDPLLMIAQKIGKSIEYLSESDCPINKRLNEFIFNVYYDESGAEFKIAKEPKDDNQYISLLDSDLDIIYHSKIIRVCKIKEVYEHPFIR